MSGLLKTIASIPPGLIGLIALGVLLDACWDATVIIILLVCLISLAVIWGC